MSKFQDVHNVVFKYVRLRNVHASDLLIREKAQELGAMLGIENFQASVVWLNSVFSRYEIVMKSICGEAKTVNEWIARKIGDLIKACIQVILSILTRSECLINLGKGKH